MILVLNVHLTIFIHTPCKPTRKKDIHTYTRMHTHFHIRISYNNNNTFPFPFPVYFEICIRKDIYQHKYSHNLNPNKSFDVILFSGILSIEINFLKQIELHNFFYHFGSISYYFRFVFDSLKMLFRTTLYVFATDIHIFFLSRI